MTEKSTLQVAIQRRGGRLLRPNASVSAFTPPLLEQPASASEHVNNFL
jgi:hypothetical protein